MSELGLVIACLVAFCGLAFIAVSLAGLVQYACDELGNAFARAMREIGRFLK